MTKINHRLLQIDQRKHLKILPLKNRFLFNKIKLVHWILSQNATPYLWKLFKSNPRFSQVLNNTFLPEPRLDLFKKKPFLLCCSSLEFTPILLNKYTLCYFLQLRILSVSKWYRLHVPLIMHYALLQSIITSTECHLF